ncbi:TerD family protein [Gordonia sp. DT30]|uniref:TerD family protein n=1 Tax=Gordonia sp. DT30 TaxID=3416546 RepID=UPI003CE98B6E
MPTHALAKGANVRVAEIFGDPAPQLDIRISATPGESLRAVDASVLVLGSGGNVQSADDLVFYNQPNALDGAVRLVGDDGTGDNEDGSDDLGGRLQIDVARLPDPIDRLIVAASADSESGEDFGLVKSLEMTVSLGSGESDESAYLRSELDGFTDERALIVAELYRHESGWKFRAVGQGYAGGLAALVTDFGVEVDDPG